MSERLRVTKFTSLNLATPNEDLATPHISRLSHPWDPKPRRPAPGGAAALGQRGKVVMGWGYFSPRNFVGKWGISTCKWVNFVGKFRGFLFKLKGMKTSSVDGGWWPGKHRTKWIWMGYSWGCTVMDSSGWIWSWPSRPDRFLSLEWWELESGNHLHGWPQVSAMFRLVN